MNKLMNRIIPIFMLFNVLVWLCLPLVSVASVLSPGQPITPGKPISPGKPIDLGEIIIPGSPIDTGRPILPGDPIQSDHQSNSSGNQNNSGSPHNGNLPESGGNVDGGDLDSGEGNQGTPIGDGNTHEGDPNNGGNLDDGSQHSGDGQISGGDNSENNNLPTSPSDLRENLSIGEHGGSIRSKNIADNNPSFLEILFDTAGSEGFIDGSVNLLSDFKTYGLDFGDDVAQALVAHYSGFQIKHYRDHLYDVNAVGKVKNPILNYFYKKFVTYNDNGKIKSLGPQTKRIKDTTLETFNESKNLTGSNNIIKNAMQSDWNPFSKDFWKASNSIKLGGPVNIALTAFDPVYNHSNGFTDFSGLKTTDFAADLTVDGAIGVGTGAVSIWASVKAGALAGTFAGPVVGTIAGAVAGLVFGIGVNYFINGTKTGRKVKEAVTKTVKKGYDAISKGVKKVFSWFGK